MFQEGVPWEEESSEKREKKEESKLTIELSCEISRENTFFTQNQLEKP